MFGAAAAHGGKATATPSIRACLKRWISNLNVCFIRTEQHESHCVYTCTKRASSFIRRFSSCGSTCSAPHQRTAPDHTGRTHRRAAAHTRVFVPRSCLRIPYGTPHPLRTYARTGPRDASADTHDGGQQRNRTAREILLPNQSDSPRV